MRPSSPQLLEVIENLDLLNDEQVQYFISCFCPMHEETILSIMRELAVQDRKEYEKRLQKAIRYLAILIKHKDGWGYARHAFQIFLNRDVYDYISGLNPVRSVTPSRWESDTFFPFGGPSGGLTKAISLDQIENTRDKRAKHRSYFGNWHANNR